MSLILDPMLVVLCPLYRVGTYICRRGIFTVHSLFLVGSIDI